MTKRTFMQRNKSEGRSGRVGTGVTVAAGQSVSALDRSREEGAGVLDRVIGKNKGLLDSSAVKTATVSRSPAGRNTGENRTMSVCRTAAVRVSPTEEKGKTTAVLARKARIVLAVLAALTLLTLFFGCDLFMAKGVTIEERIDMFMKDVNAGNYGKLYTHIHPDAELYEQTKSADYWNKPDVFPSGEKYTLGLVVPVGNLVTTKINSMSRYDNDTIIFEMAKDGDDYKIKKITIKTSVILFNLVSR